MAVRGVSSPLRQAKPESGDQAVSASTVFTNNRTQAVRLPVDLRFPDSVKKVEVRAVGHERIIAPADRAWDSFFLGANLPSEDFMSVRAGQEQVDRETF